jgi:hypothetical protein
VLGDERTGWGAYSNKLGYVRLGKQYKVEKGKSWGPQSICQPVLDVNLKERFLKERPRPIQIEVKSYDQVWVIVCFKLRSF